jgi:hypothetical protein
MAFNINEIRSQLTGGGARPSLFQVQITNPANGAGDLKVPFMCKAAALPTSNLGTIEVPYFGRKIKIAGDRTFDEWTVTIINDEDFLIRNAMEQWMNSINLHQQNTNAFGTSAPSAYKSQATVQQYGKDGRVLRVYNFNGLFPTNVSEIAVDWDTPDTIQEFTVTFQYDWWNVSGGVTGNAGGQ